MPHVKAPATAEKPRRHQPTRQTARLTAEDLRRVGHTLAQAISSGETRRVEELCASLPPHAVPGLMHDVVYRSVSSVTINDEAGFAQNQTVMLPILVKSSDELPERICMDQTASTLSSRLAAKLEEAGVLGVLGTFCSLALSFEIASTMSIYESLSVHETLLVGAAAREHCIPDESVYDGPVFSGGWRIYFLNVGLSAFFPDAMSAADDQSKLFDQVLGVSDTLLLTLRACVQFDLETSSGGDGPDVVMLPMRRPREAFGMAISEVISRTMDIPSGRASLPLFVRENAFDQRVAPGCDLIEIDGDTDEGVRFALANYISGGLGPEAFIRKALGWS